MSGRALTPKLSSYREEPDRVPGRGGRGNRMRADTRQAVDLEARFWARLFDDALGTARRPALLLRELLLSRTGPTAHVELDRAEGLLVPLDCHAQSREQALGCIEIHDDPLVRLDVL